jgi:hypothetical protein
MISGAAQVLESEREMEKTGREEGKRGRGEGEYPGIEGCHTWFS